MPDRVLVYLLVHLMDASTPVDVKGRTDPSGSRDLSAVASLTYCWRRSGNKSRKEPSNYSIKKIFP
jgi:hypothetical protein